MNPSPIAQSIWLLLLIGLALSILPACGEPRRPSVILVTIDTLRGDRIGVAGYEKARTPHIDDLARRGLYFSHAVSPVPITLPSHASIMTGLTPPAHGVRDNSPFPLPTGATTLAEVLAEEGFETAAFVASQPLAPGCGLEQGFSDYQFGVPLPAQGELFLAERSADQVTDAALEWLDRRTNSEKPFFLWVHYFDPHAPYAPPPRLINEVVSGDAYDGEIAFVDEQLGRLLRETRNRSKKEGLIEILTADHGESLGEHNETTHAYFTFESTLRVPLIFAGPGIPSSSPPDLRAARLVDVMPTLLDILDLPCPTSQGVSLLKQDPGPAYSESLYCAEHFDWAQITTVRIENQKLIDAGRYYLFDLASDPDERHELTGGDSAKIPFELLEALKRATSVEANEALDPQVPPIPGYLGSGRRERPRLLDSEENAKKRSPLEHSDLVQRFEAALAALVTGNHTDAVNSLSLAIQADPQNPTFLFWMGQTWWYRANKTLAPEHWQVAADWFEKTSRLSAQHLDAQNLLIHCLANLGRFRDARQRGLRLESEELADGWTFEMLGRLYLTPKHQGIVNPVADRQLGIEYLEKAIARRPSSIQALQLLADAYKDGNQKEKEARIRRRLHALSEARPPRARAP